MVKTNLTQLYSNGENPNIIGREKELQLVMLTLMRREKPNPLLISEPGVGKTAMAHLLAYHIANGLVPDQLKGFQVIEINTNGLLAGPGYRGVFEERVQQLIDESINDGKTIFFIDEFHTVENLGGMASGQSPGMGNTLKPYLTRPDFRVMGATTNQEFSEIKDKALLRRFFKIQITEPTDEALRAIIRVCLKEYGSGLRFKTSEVIEKILLLSKSLDGHNPDKVKDISDFACSYAKMNGITEIDANFISSFFDYYFLMRKTQDEDEAILE